MSESKHTPGPWHWDGYWLKASDGTIVADDGSAGGEYTDTLTPDSPDGRLVAAAPVLLEACKKALTCNLDSSVRELVVAAVKLAEGKE